MDKKNEIGEKPMTNLPKPNGYKAQDAIKNCAESMFYQCQTLHKITQENGDSTSQKAADAMFNLLLEVINLNWNGAQVHPTERIRNGK